MLKVLFIGNSYTSGIQPALQRVVAGSPHREAYLSFVHVGGITLGRLIERDLAARAIDRDAWDYVVLQEQSQLPALDGDHRRAFDTAVDTLVGTIRARAAEPILYMTWGRRDHDAEFPDLLPDFATMQHRLSDAYRQAATRHGAAIAPVGEAWARVREQDADLGRRLYADDGSHPSDTGAFLAACVFYRLLFNDTLDTVRPPDGMTDADAALIKRAVQ